MLLRTGEGAGYQVFGNFTSIGWPLFEPRFTSAMVAGFYTTGVKTIGDNLLVSILSFLCSFPFVDSTTAHSPEIFPGKENEPIATIPTFSSLYLTVDGATYRVGTPSAEITNYRQEMSIQDGLVKTSLSWKGLNISYSMFAHRTLPNLAVVRLDVAGLSPSSRATVTDLLDVSIPCRRKGFLVLIPIFRRERERSELLPSLLDISPTTSPTRSTRPSLPLVTSTK